jgi:LytR cell envelope-related transcriptional attenuator
MAELRTGGGPTGNEPPFDPPRGDEGLDDWFARRLEAQGISAGRRRIPVARVLAVLALVATLATFGWILNGVTSGSTSTTTKTTSSQSTTPTSGTTTTSTTHKAKKPAWQRIPLTILNGFGGANAAGTVKLQLQRAGWHVLAAADAAQPTTTATIVVYVPGKLSSAKIVARRLGLGAPVPIASASGVLSTQTDGVAIVLGPNLLPNGAG